MKMQNQNQSINTSDFCLAAYLLAKNISLIETLRDDSSRVTFVYQNSAELSLLIDKYFQMKAVIEPMAFFSAQKRLKQLIYQR